MTLSRKIIRGASIAALMVAALALGACANNPAGDARPARPAPRRRAASRTSSSMSATACSSRPTQTELTRAGARDARQAGAVAAAATASYTFTIEGHADERGTREYNIALGARRAQAVRDYLASRGIQAQRMRTISYGKERPVAVCNDISCWSQNRRAVTVLNATS